MDRIPTFLCNYTPSLLKAFSFGCLGRCRGKHKSDEEADVGDGIASPCEKNTLPYLYDPAIEKPAPMGDEQDGVVEISLVSDDEDGAKEATSMTPVSRARATKARSKSPVVEAPLQKPARAKLLDILIQFPLPPSFREDGTAAQGALNLAPKAPQRQRKSTKKQHRVKRSSTDIVDPQATPVLMPLSPVSTRRSSLVWFADKSTCGDDFSTDSNNGWVSVQHSAGSDTHNPEWISDWRDDMATVLKELQKVQKQEEDEDFRDLLADASVSSHGSSALSRSSASLSGHVARWSGKWAVQSFEL